MLQPLVIVGHVRGQVAVDDADIIAVKLQADVDAPFVPLVGQVGRRVESCSGWDTPLSTHFKTEGNGLTSHRSPRARHLASQSDLSIYGAQLIQPEVLGC